MVLFPCRALHHPYFCRHFPHISPGSSPCAGERPQRCPGLGLIAAPEAPGPCHAAPPARTKLNRHRSCPHFLHIPPAALVAPIPRDERGLPAGPPAGPRPPPTARVGRCRRGPRRLGQGRAGGCGARGAGPGSLCPGSCLSTARQRRDAAGAVLAPDRPREPRQHRGSACRPRQRETEPGAPSVPRLLRHRQCRTEQADYIPLSPWWRFFVILAFIGPLPLAGHPGLAAKFQL